MSIKTRNVNELSEETDNIYETAIIVSRRADQIAQELKAELTLRLEPFALREDSPDREVFANEEQIELSEQYENLPKPTQLALQEFEKGRVHYHFVEPEKESDPLAAVSPEPKSEAKK